VGLLQDNAQSEAELSVDSPIAWLLSLLADSFRLSMRSVEELVALHS
jgi:hypothetical protein